MEYTSIYIVLKLFGCYICVIIVVLSLFIIGARAENLLTSPIHFFRGMSLITKK